jgi:hypothetical protein
VRRGRCGQQMQQRGGGVHQEWGIAWPAPWEGYGPKVIFHITAVQHKRSEGHPIALRYASYSAAYD